MVAGIVGLLKLGVADIENKADQNNARNGSRMAQEESE